MACFSAMLMKILDVLKFVIVLVGFGQQPEVLPTKPIAPDALCRLPELQDDSAGVEELPPAPLLVLVVPRDDLPGEEGLEQEGREVHLDVVRRREDVHFAGRDSL